MVVDLPLYSATVMHDLSENAKFFDRLVDLVPAKYYHPSDQELVNTKYLKKNAKAAAKQVMKEQYKQNKRAKLNPDTAKTSLQIQQQQADDLQQSDSSDEDDAAEPALPQSAQQQKPEPVRTLNLPTGVVSFVCAYVHVLACSLTHCCNAQVVHHPTQLCKKNCSSGYRYDSTSTSNNCSPALDYIFITFTLSDDACRSCVTSAMLTKKSTSQAKAKRRKTKTRTRASSASIVYPRRLGQLLLPRHGDTVN